MSRGIFLVKIEEIQVALRKAKASANASLGTDQDEYGDSTKTIFVVRKVLDKDGMPRRKNN